MGPLRSCSRRTGQRLSQRDQAPRPLKLRESKCLGVEFIASDAGDAGAANVLVEHVPDKHGRVDVVFANANAGFDRLAPIEAVDEAIFDTLLNVTLRGPFAS